MAKCGVIDFLILVTLSATLLSVCSSVNASIEEDRQALLDFLGNSSHPQSLNWDINTSACTQWTGILCDADHARVVEIHLPGIGFRGPIPRNTLSRLSALQVLSLRVNRLSGSFPPDFDRLSNLTAIYLKSNNFSGPLPRDFSVWKSLSVLDLSNNAFSGTIPSSLANLTQLSVLNLSRNSLSGPVPDLRNPSLVEIDLANNSLTGTVPRSMLRFPRSAFVGNELMLATAVPPSFPVEPPIPQALPVRKARRRRITEPVLLGIAIGGCVLVFVMIAMLLLVLRSKSNRTRGPASAVAKPEKESSMKKTKKKSNDVSGESHEKTNRLFFFEGCSLAFDLEDLLRASAEVLGKGTFGTTYKAALEDAAATLVVKRLKEVTVPRRDFETQMEIVGNVRHENVVPLRAYFYSKDEKLIVFDFYEQGNVSAMLHGGRGPGRVPLDWETRVKIAIGAARGIAHIQTCNAGRLVHGNVKAANVFLNPQGYGCVSDVGLAALMNPTPAPVSRAAGYRAPEVSDTRKATAASDVYSFGVLLLELLTGKSPVHATGTEEVVHLVRWVNSVVREEWTAEVFDVELLRYPNIEEEMVEMLQLGMSCVLKVPEKRPSIVSVLKSLEEIRQPNTGTRPSSEVSTPIPTPDAVVAEIVGPSSSSSLPK